MRARDQLMQLLDVDMVFLMATLMLLALGTTMIFSSSYFLSKETSGNSLAMIMKHFFHLGLGTVVMALIIRTDYRKFNTQKFVMAMLGAGILLCILCFVPGIGIEAGNAKRWVRLVVISLQASEFLKIALIFYLAYFLTRKEKRLEDFTNGILPMLVIIGICYLLILAEPDFGTASIIGLWSIIVLFAGGMKMKHLGWLSLVCIPAVILVMIMEPYRVRRLLAFWDPWNDIQGISYQIVQSMVAFANGGLFGSGLGESTQKMFFLPAPHTDFIFSVLGEELGFLGVSAALLLYGLWIWRGLTIAMSTKDSFGFYLALSAISLVALQAVVNMSVSMSIFPTTGVTLPFLSYGGSSIMTVFIISGIVLSVSRGARI